MPVGEFSGLGPNARQLGAIWKLVCSATGVCNVLFRSALGFVMCGCNSGKAKEKLFVGKLSP